MSAESCSDLNVQADDCERQTESNPFIFPEPSGTDRKAPFALFFASTNSTATVDRVDELLLSTGGDQGNNFVIHNSTLTEDFVCISKESLVRQSEQDFLAADQEICSRNRIISDAGSARDNTTQPVDNSTVSDQSSTTVFSHSGAWAPASFQGSFPKDVFKTEVEVSQVVSNLPTRGRYDFNAILQSQLPGPNEENNSPTPTIQNWRSVSSTTDSSAPINYLNSFKDLVSSSDQFTDDPEKDAAIELLQLSQTPVGLAKQPAIHENSATDKPKRKRKRPNYEPEEKEWVDPTDADVLLGRGGRTNHHPGNQQYLAAKEAMQPRYLAGSKEEKTQISQELVNHVRQRGGRFLKLDPETNKWYIVANIVARKKASQTLREWNTVEERAAKRERYQFGKAYSAV